MRSSITTRTPFPTACGDAAVRTADSRFMGPSGLMPVAGRCAPTTTTGRSLRTARYRKKAVSSRRSVPCVTTTPASSGRAASRALMRRASPTHMAGVMLVLATLLNCSASTRACRPSSGTDATTCSALSVPARYPPRVPGASCTPAMVPPVAITSTRGRVVSTGAAMGADASRGGPCARSGDDATAASRAAPSTTSRRAARLAASCLTASSPPPAPRGCLPPRGA